MLIWLAEGIGYCHGLRGHGMPCPYCTVWLRTLVLTRGSQRSEHIRNRCRVTERLADVREPVDIARSKNEARAQLEWIFTELVLAMPGRVRTLPRDRIVTPKQVQERRFFEVSHAISLKLCIDEQRKRDPRLFAENPRVTDIAQPDRGKIRSARLDFRLVLAQLRDVLAAKHSAVMPQENDRRRTIGPQRPKPHRPFIAIRQNDFRKFRAERFVHHCVRSNPNFP